MKQLYPADEEYQQKVAEYLKFSDSVNVVIADIESSLTDENETEVKELKKTLAKKPKRIRNKKPASAPNTITLTEQIVELANEPTIKRGPDQADDVEYVIAVSDSEGEEEPKPEVVVEVVKEVIKPVKKKATKKTKKADIDDDPRPNPTWVHPIVCTYGSDSEDEEEVKEEPKEEVKVVEEVVKPVVVEEVKVVKKKPTKKATKKTEIVNDPLPTPALVVEEVAIPKVIVKEQLDVEVPKELPVKKVSKPRVKKVVEKKPEEVQQPVVVVEELTEENEV
jgi:hypothetical protein